MHSIFPQSNARSNEMSNKAQGPSLQDQESLIEIDQFYTPTDTEPLLGIPSSTSKLPVQDGQPASSSNLQAQAGRPNPITLHSFQTGDFSTDLETGNAAYFHHPPSTLQQSRTSSLLNAHRSSSNLFPMSCLGATIYLRSSDKTWFFLLCSLGLSFLLFSSFLLGLVSRLLLAPSLTTDPSLAVPVKNIIFMISDGFGPASQTLARNYYQSINGFPENTTLPLDSILVGSSRTRSASSLVTDSAAGATAFSCGLKTFNGAIGVDEEGKVCATVLEAASEMGFRTGLVVTSRITHATPAAFSAHVLGRDDESVIAVQQIGNYSLGRKVDLLLGGGSCFFLPNSSSESCRSDNTDVYAMAREKHGWTIGQSLQDLTTASPSSLPYLHLFSPSHMDYELDRDQDTQPSLTQMLSKALEILSPGPGHRKTGQHGGGNSGFFLMVEGSRIDMAAHTNDPATHIKEILSYNDAVSQAIAYVSKHPDTLLISTSDHETGGLSDAVQLNASVYPIYNWSPAPLSKVAHSAEYMALKLSTLPPVLSRTDYVKNVILRDWMGLDKEDVEEEVRNGNVEFLVSPDTSMTDLAYRLGLISSKRAQIGWATHGHSAVDVNLYAYGAQSHRLRGNHENTDIGHLISSLWNLNLTALTLRLNSTMSL